MRDAELIWVDGVVRFKGNKIVRWLLDEASQGRRVDLNRIWAHGFSPAELQHFYRLIGYSVSGYGEVFPAAKSTREADALAADMVAAKKRRIKR